MDDPLEVVMSFGEACNAHDLQGALDLCADDVVFEGTTPPDGEHVVGHAELRNVWAPIFENSLSHVEVEESIVIGDRVVQRCLYSWGEGHVRAVDLYRVHSGKIAEKLSYVKGSSSYRPDEARCGRRAVGASPMCRSAAIANVTPALWDSSSRTMHSDCRR